MNDDTRALIDRADLDGLIRLVDNFCDSRDWDALADLRDACRAATQSGRQVWPASTLAEYRLALLAPAEHAVEMLDDPGRFTIGPLTEVIAQHHTWEELSDLLDDGPQAAFVAHERAIRGEVIDDGVFDGGVFDVLDIPVALADWEPDYALAVYRDNDGVFDSPLPPSTEAVRAMDGTPVAVTDTVRDAFAQLVAPWTESSNGRLAIVAVEGDERAALGALGVTSPRLGSMTGADAIRWLAWAGASGGAYGRRRGNAIGRFNAWWTVAALAALQWPPTDADMLGALDALRWSWWEGDVTPTGWRLQLVVHDPRHDTTLIVDGRDAR